MNKTDRSATMVPAVGAQVERGVRRRVNVTTNERWREVKRTVETKNIGNARTQWHRATTSVLEEVRELQLECGHWLRWDLAVGRKHVYMCHDCEAEYEEPPNVLVSRQGGADE